MRAFLSRLLPVGTMYKMVLTILFVSVFTCSYAQKDKLTFKELWQYSRMLDKIPSKELNGISNQIDEYLDIILATIEKDSVFPNIDTTEITAIMEGTLTADSLSIRLIYADNKTFSIHNKENETFDIAEITDFFSAIYSNGGIEKTVNSVIVTYELINDDFNCPYKLDYELIQRDSLEITNRVVRKIEEPILKD